MKFFKPSDFDGQITATEKNSLVNIADAANAKLEREGKVVKGSFDGSYVDGFNDWPYPDVSNCKALLINIEPLVKCEHPRERIRFIIPKDYSSKDGYSYYSCECGARVKPKSFEVCE